MRFLVDAQLPPALARWLASQGHAAEHVGDLGLHDATDAALWAIAQDRGATIISKDEDFAILRTRLTDGPSIVWIRKGNVGRKDLLTWFAPMLASVCDALDRGETLIEVS